MIPFARQALQIREAAQALGVDAVERHQDLQAHQHPDPPISRRGGA